MTFSDEILMAYADGELDAATRAAVDAASAADPALTARIARQRAVRERLRAAFDPVLDEPLPERLLAAARGAAADRGHKAPLPRRPTTTAPRWSWPQWGALAASLVLGALLGPRLLRAPADGVLSARDGQLLARGALAQALSAQLAGNQPRSAPVQIGVSFRARNGEFCRTFRLAQRNALGGVACRESAGWVLQVLAAAAAQPAGDAYRPAAAALPPAVTRSVDEIIDGEPLDAQAERAALARDWQP